MTSGNNFISVSGILSKAALTVIILTLLVPAVSTGETSDRLKDKSRLYAASQAMTVLLADLPERKIDGVAESSTELMLKDIRANQNRADSEVVIRKHLHERAAALLEREQDELQKHFRVVIGDRFREQKSSAIESYLISQGEGVFMQARNDAVNSQLNEVSLQVYPEERQVMDLDASGWSETESVVLKKRLSVQMRNRQKLLFDEVTDKINRRVEEIYDNIRSQFDSQHNAVENFEPPGTLVTREQMAESWISNVELARQSMLQGRQAWQKVYPLFPSLSEDVQKRAVRLEQGRYRDYMGSAALTGVDRPAVEGVVLGNIEMHRKAGASLEVVVKTLLPDIEKSIVDTRLDAAPENQRVAYRSRIENDYNKRFGDVLRNRVRSEVKPLHTVIRNALAMNQLQIYFPSLADWSLELTGEHEEIIRRVKDDNNLSIGSFRDCAVPPVSTAITANGSMPDGLLEETERLVHDRVGDLLYEAGKAWDGQDTIYKSHKRLIAKGVGRGVVDIEQEIRTTPPQTLDAWVDHFMGMIREVWSSHRLNLMWGNEPMPAYSQNKYMELFQEIENSVRKQLTTGVGAVLEKIRQEQLAEETAQKRAEEERIKAEEEKVKAEEERVKAEKLERKRIEASSAAGMGALETESSPDISELDTGTDMNTAADREVKQDTLQQHSIEYQQGAAAAGDGSTPADLRQQVTVKPEERSASSLLAWLILLLFAFLAVLAYQYYRFRRRDTSKSIMNGLREWLGTARSAYMILVMLTAIQTLLVLYLLTRDPFSGGAGFVYDAVRTGNGEYYYYNGDYVLVIRSQSWNPPSDMAIEVRKE